MAENEPKKQKRKKDKKKKKSAVEDKGTVSGADDGEVKAGPAKVTLRNNCSHPVFFRMPGKTIRIGPRGTREVEESSLSTGELGRLYSKNQVSVIK